MQKKKYFSPKRKLKNKYILSEYNIENSNHNYSFTSQCIIVYALKSLWNVRHAV